VSIIKLGCAQTKGGKSERYYEVVRSYNTRVANNSALFIKIFFLTIPADHKSATAPGGRSYHQRL
jgi:hypothetical protein